MENKSNNELLNKKKLLLLIIIRVALVYIFIGILLFIPAGNIIYLNGWVYLTAMFIPMVFSIIYFFKTDPLLLEKRMRIKETQKKQKRYILMSLILFIITFLIPGFDYRYNWSDVPLWLVIVSLFFFEFGYIMFIAVLRQNSFASRIIEIQEGQRVINTGLYSIVRHPMYLAAILIYISSPIILGSYYALIPTAFLPSILAFRISNEEKVLNELSGYREYKEKVKYRLIPFVW